MLEEFLSGNEVSNLRLEDEDFLLEAEGYTKQKREEVALGRIKQQKEDDIRPKKVCICPQDLRGHTIQRGYIRKIGMKFSRKKTNGK